MTEKIISIGRIVHIQVEEGKYRPAMVVEVHNIETGSINANAFMDGLNDSHLFDVIYKVNKTTANVPLMKWYTSITPGDEVGQWRWPVRV